MTTRFSFTRKLLCAALLASAATACAPDDPDTSTSDSEIIGGFPVRSAKLDAIGSLGYDMGDGTFFPFCTGTLITPNTVLTAEHCVNWLPDATPVRFLVGYDAYNPKQVIQASGFAWESSVDGGVIGNGSDVAVLHLAEPVAGVTPMPYAALDPSQIGRRFTGVGYGVQDVYGTAGTRKAGAMTFQALGGPVFGAVYGSFEDFLAEGVPHFFPEYDPSNPDDLAVLQEVYDYYQLIAGIESWFGNGHGDAQACNGDSGGPITALTAGKTTVYGVASWVLNNQPLCELGTAYASLEPISLDFIDYELNCPMIPREGTCDGLNTVVRCATPEEGGYHELRTDCSELGLICGIDDAGELGCIDDPCEGLPEGGSCDGTTVTRCTTPEEGPRRVVTMDCAELGMTCGLDEAGQSTCVDDGIPDCTHEVCEEGPALDTSCTSCSASVCEADPYCCDTYWDSICVGEVEQFCGATGESCPAAAVSADDISARMGR